MVQEVVYLARTILIYGLCTVFLIWFAKVLLRWNRQRRLLSKLPGHKGLPIIGVALEMIGETSFGINEKLTVKYSNFDGGISSTWVGFDPFVFVYTAETMEEILTSNVHINKGDLYNYLQEWIGLGLLISGGNRWHSQRKMLTPAFHFQILETYIETFNRESNQLISKLKEFAKSGEAFDIVHYITLCTLDVIMETALNKSVKAQEGHGKAYLDALSSESKIIMERIAKPWLHYNFGLKLCNLEKQNKENLRILHEKSTGAIEEGKQFYLNNKDNVENIEKKKKISFMEILLKKHLKENALSELEIREQVDTFMFEGHDTTTSAISFTLYTLGCYPECQRKIQEELDGIFENKEQLATSEDLKKMTYLECCIKESMRLFPTVQWTSRHLQEHAYICGYLIPEGTNVLLNIRKLHMDPKVFPDPQKYNPERFFPENCVDRSPFAYLPFSAGPRNCIGQRFALMEMKSVLSSIFRNFTIESEIGRIEDMKITNEVVLRPNDGKIMMKFKERQ